MDSENLKKMFIGGLHPDTTDDSLINFYNQWGEVADAIVMRDSATKRSRGFGFITFKEAYSVDECMKARPHIVDGKQVDPKRATPKEDAQNPVARKQVKKIFVGGIRDGTENNDLIQYFSQYGPVTQADIVVDKQTGRKRGFAFVTFEDADAVDKCVLVGNHSLNGNPCEVKKAMERGMEGGGPQGGRGGGRGGPRGGGGYAPYGGADYSSGGYGGGYGAPTGGYGAPAGSYGGGSWNYGSEFGSGYGTSNGGGAMKNGGYASRAAGPYAAGGSYAPPAPTAGAYAGYNSSYGAGYGGY
jgi:heterogeneous nuclear ribonucleoprotein A1/A3